MLINHGCNSWCAWVLVGQQQSTLPWSVYCLLQNCRFAALSCQAASRNLPLCRIGAKSSICAPRANARWRRTPSPSSCGFLLARPRGAAAAAAAAGTRIRTSRSARHPPRILSPFPDPSSSLPRDPDSCRILPASSCAFLHSVRPGWWCDDGEDGRLCLISSRSETLCLVWSDDGDGAGDLVGGGLGFGWSPSPNPRIRLIILGHSFGWICMYVRACVSWGDLTGSSLRLPPSCQGTYFSSSSTTNYNFILLCVYDMKRKIFLFYPVFF